VMKRGRCGFSFFLKLHLHNVM